MSRQVVRAADKYGSHAVVVASLTRAAAEEVGGRGTGLPKDRIGTLHSHAFRALERPKIAEGREGVAAWNAWCEANAFHFGKLSGGGTVDPDQPTEVFTGSTPGDRALAALNVARQRMVDPRFHPSHEVRRFYPKWEEWKADERWTDFTDLIERAIDEVDEAPGQPAVFMLDEAQDMSRLEFTLARKWGARCEQLVTVGDPFQNLYEWRGSDPDAFDSASEPIVLKRSWRVSAAVHDYAVKWARRIDRPFPEYLPRLADFNHADPDDEGAAVAEGEVRSTDATWPEPERLMEDVRRDLARTVSDWRWDGERFVAYERPATVMVLTTCGFMLEPLVGHLKELGVPFGNPYRPTRGDWNPMRGAGRLLSFLRPDAQTWGDEARFWSWEDVRTWLDPLRARGVLSHGAKNRVEVWAQPDRFSKEVAEAKASDVLRLFAEEAHAESAFTFDVDWWQSHLLDSRKKQMIYPCKVYRQHGGAALRGRPRLILGTIHSVKGGQADYVYVFPDLSRVSWATQWDETQPLPPGAREAIIRQFYVAATRAREGLRIGRASTSFYVPIPRP